MSIYSVDSRLLFCDMKAALDSRLYNSVTPPLTKTSAWEIHFTSRSRVRVYGDYLHEFTTRSRARQSCTFYPTSLLLLLVCTNLNSNSKPLESWLKLKTSGKQRKRNKVCSLQHISSSTPNLYTIGPSIAIHDSFVGSIPPGCPNQCRRLT